MVVLTEPYQHSQMGLLSDAMKQSLRGCFSLCHTSKKSREKEEKGSWAALTELQPCLKYGGGNRGGGGGPRKQHALWLSCFFCSRQGRSVQYKHSSVVLNTTNISYRIRGVSIRQDFSYILCALLVTL